MCVYETNSKFEVISGTYALRFFVTPVKIITPPHQRVRHQDTLHLWAIGSQGGQWASRVSLGIGVDL